MSNSKRKAIPTQLRHKTIKKMATSKQLTARNRGKFYEGSNRYNVKNEKIALVHMCQSQREEYIIP